ncbi:MAG TPA: DNA integrity scanning protein DisA nucleotide-binding domain protein [Acidimicrobiales bacterium]
MPGPDQLSRPARRLRSELADDGVEIGVDAALVPLVLDELVYARRPPRFERRVPLYGSLVVPDDRSLVAAGDLVDLVPVDRHPLPVARRFADGRSTYLARHPDGRRQLAFFRRSVQYEADLVEIQADTGVVIVQRTPVMEVTRVFTSDATVEWAGDRWTSRPNARALHDKVRPWLPGIAAPVIAGLLELALHWLSPGRVGATLVVPVGDSGDGLDLARATPIPRLSVTTRHHYPALFSALLQTDLAAVVDADGSVHHIGVGLHWSGDATAHVRTTRGMRHRSAARYTYDHPEAVAVVVSEDGPVTVFRRGRSLSECAAGQVTEQAAATG